MAVLLVKPAVQETAVVAGGAVQQAQLALASLPIIAESSPTPAHSQRLAGYLVAHSQFAAPIGRRNVWSSVLAVGSGHHARFLRVCRDPLNATGPRRARPWAAWGCCRSPARASDDDARAWLERMSEALATRNYDGLFTHTTGRQSETMRIVHRVGRNGSTERLVSLDGSGREIVRTRSEVHVYLPDRRVVLVEPRTDDGSLLKALPAPGPQLDALYELRISEGNKLLGREVRVLDIRPRDALPLRLSAVARRGDGHAAALGRGGRHAADRSS